MIALKEVEVDEYKTFDLKGGKFVKRKNKMELFPFQNNDLYIFFFFFLGAENSRIKREITVPQHRIVLNLLFICN